MAGTHFRARQVDQTKKLHIYLTEELPDLDDFSIQRTLPQMATGMEKEEEEEHHLKIIINKSSVYGNSTGDKRNSKPVVIPTPDAQEMVDYYDEFYKPNFKLPSSHYIRIQDRFQGNEGALDQHEYDADTEDEEFVINFNEKHNKKLTSRQKATLKSLQTDMKDGTKVNSSSLLQEGRLVLGIGLFEDILEAFERASPLGRALISLSKYFAKTPANKDFSRSQRSSFKHQYRSYNM